MCTFNITVDEQIISRMSPAISREAFGLLLQRYVDEFVKHFVTDPVIPPCSYTEDEMYAIVKERLKSIEDGTAEFVDNETLLEQIRTRYGFSKQMA